MRQYMIKSGAIILVLTLLAGVFSGVNVHADGVTNQSYLALGADLTAKEKREVLRLLDVDEDELDEYNVVEITNKQEHQYLDSYLSASVIGSRALSSVLVEEREEGEGIDVSTKNISYCTDKMYINALTTAGITDADVKVAGPFSITGTAALVGAMKAYEEMTGEEISEEKEDAATNELVVTGELGEQMDDPEKAQELLALIKERVIEEDVQDTDDIQNIIEESCKEMDVELTDEEKQQISDLMEKIDNLDLDINVLKKQAEEVYQEVKNLDLDTEGFFQKIFRFFQNFFDSLSGE